MNLKKLLISSVFVTKILFNGIGVFGISLWFWLICILFILVIYENNAKQFPRTFIVKLFLFCILVIDMVLVSLLRMKLIPNAISVIQLVFMIMFYYSVFASNPKKREIEFYVNTIIVSITISALVGFLQFLNIGVILEFSQLLKPESIIVNGGRVAGLSSTIITFSYELIALIVMITETKLLKRSMSFKWVVIYMFVLIVLFIGQTRSSLIAVGLYLTFKMIKLFLNGRKGVRVFISISAISFFLTSYFLVSSGVLELRFSSDVSSSVRLPMMITAIKQSLINPIGTAIYEVNFDAISSTYSPLTRELILGNSSHNHILNILVQYGWLGLSLLIGVYSCLLMELRQNTTNKTVELYSRLFGMILILYTINGFFHNAGLMSSLPIVWFSMSIISVVHSRRFHSSVSIDDY